MHRRRLPALAAVCLILTLTLDTRPLPACAADRDGSDSPAAHHVSRGESTARWLEARGFSRTTAVAAISMLPIIELRGAVPVGIVAFGLPWWKVYAIAVIGNMIPIPFILLLLGPLSRLLMRLRAGSVFFDWLFARTRRRSASIAKYEALGLTIFVAIPLPATGGWTGAMAAFLMGTPFWRAMGCILLGVMIAGVIMTALSLLGWVGAVVAGGALIAMASGGVLRGFGRKGRADSPTS